MCAVISHQKLIILNFRGMMIVSGMFFLQFSMHADDLDWSQ